MGSNKYDTNARQGIVTKTVPNDTETEQVNLEDLYNKTIYCLYHSLDILDPTSVEVLTNLLSCVSMVKSQEEANAMYTLMKNLPQDSGQINPTATFEGEEPLRK
jgi:hypothetical protein